MQVSIIIPLDSNQIVSFEELLMSQVIQQEAFTRLLVEKGVFTKEDLAVALSRPAGNTSKAL